MLGSKVRGMWADLHIDQLAQKLLLDDVLDGGIILESDGRGHHLGDKVGLLQRLLIQLPSLCCIHCLRIKVWRIFDEHR